MHYFILLNCLLFNCKGEGLLHICLYCLAVCNYASCFLICNQDNGNMFSKNNIFLLNEVFDYYNDFCYDSFWNENIQVCHVFLSFLVNYSFSV